MHNLHSTNQALQKGSELHCLEAHKTRDAAPYLKTHAAPLRYLRNPTGFEYNRAVFHADFGHRHPQVAVQGVL